MRILLTGWRGYVGGAALAAARARGADVTVLVRSDEETAAALAQRLRAARSDLADPASRGPDGRTESALLMIQGVPSRTAPDLRLFGKGGLERVAGIEPA